ncbi:hypothetical protein TspCOW1_22280 [Thiohalobacter sp. COW1]|uniref:5,10-methylene-tetrahydrofolate dehydrogenase/methenyl tetrahydrofolate cyclohydrolase n=1 Tax=Thiohalobacter thiocyanaticus TaxID=585455 RepID=A0A1Z4VNW5_9GAMM|nr:MULTISPECIES: hypothetical protein [Thiohalobacter]BAZ92914.1 5,10-methylene-tetrahydrofolate dehydrogenase/methenyl tetrahydrofolate cyclohydrolase [Thiohalobacter thiocyanaticus]BCO32125.1 hypothetical protein TspCOW1_22280 [Thiohalobacter sp. COW1]
MPGKHHKTTAFLVYLLVLVIALVPARLAVAIPAAFDQGQSPDSALTAAHCQQMAMQRAGNEPEGQELADPDRGMDCCKMVCDCPSCDQCLHASGSILTLPGGVGNANPDFHPLMCAHTESALRGIELSPPYIPPQI